MHYLEGEQRAYAQTRLSTVEAGLATEHMQSQASMQQQYLHQVQEVNAQLYLAEGRYAERIRQQNSAHQGQIEQLRRELREAQELAEVNSMDLRAEKLEFHQQGERHAYLLSSERAQVRKTWPFRPKNGKQHAESISTQATETIQAVQLERDEGHEETDQLSQALIHARSELESGKNGTVQLTNGKDGKKRTFSPFLMNNLGAHQRHHRWYNPLSPRNFFRHAPFSLSYLRLGVHRLRPRHLEMATVHHTQGMVLPFLPLHLLFLNNCFIQDLEVACLLLLSPLLLSPLELLLAIPGHTPERECRLLLKLIFSLAKTSAGGQ